MIEVLLDLLNKKIPDLIGKFTVVTNKQNQDQRLGEVNAMLRHSRRAIGRIHFFK